MHCYTKINIQRIVNALLFRVAKTMLFMGFSKLGKEYVKSVYFHSAYLTYMQSTSCEMLDWMTHT